jgi:hypothetical protein
VGPIVDGERYRVALFLAGKGDGRSVAVLYRVADEIRHDLPESVCNCKTASGWPARISIIASSHTC